MMTYRTRINYTAEQRAEIWDRWQRGESLNAIGRLFDRPSSSIFNLQSVSSYGRYPSAIASTVQLGADAIGT